MRLLIISDTHGYIDAARKVIQDRGPWDHVIHLGDSLEDAIDLAVELSIDIAAVRGNNEHPQPPGHKDELVFDSCGVTFYAIHGHELDINPWSSGFERSLSELARLAKEAGASIALFGHTHQAMVRKVEGVLMVNPGGLGLGDQEKTYAVIEAEGGKTMAEIVVFEGGN